MENKSKKIVALLVLIVILVVIVVLFESKHQNEQNAAAPRSQLATNWSDYKNSQYGFGFTYPTSWGKPRLTVQTPSDKPSSIKSQTGSYYQVAFPSMTTAVVSMNFYSVDYTAESCDSHGQCARDSGISDTTIKSALRNAPKNTFFSRDSDSYATLLYSGQNKPIAGVSINRLVSLPKINVNAVMAIYSVLKPAASCPTNMLSNSSAGNCATKDDYQNLNKMVKGLSQI